MPQRWRSFPIVGGAYTDDALSWAHQDTVNLLPVMAERKGTRTPAKLAMRPGMRVVADLGAPHRGGRDVEGKRFVVAGTTLYQLNNDNTFTSRGTIPGTGRVVMTHNHITGGNQLVIANGSSGYVYDTSTETLSQITDDGFPGALTVDFLGQRILGVEPFRRYWFYSDLADATSYNSLNSNQAETSPDRIVGLIAAHNIAWIFGERTIEPWVNSPTGNTAFQLQTGSVIESGCASPWTIQRMSSGAIAYLTNHGQVAVLNGYTPQIISTAAMEGEISRCDLSKAFAFVWEDKGHACYILTFPDGKTWVYDFAQNEWCRFKSYDRDRWRLNTLFKWNGDWYGGDAYSGKLYQLDWAYALDGCDEIERIRTSPYIYDASNRYRVNAFQVEVDTGGVPSYCAPFISGELSDTCDDSTYSQTLAIDGLNAPFSDVTVVSGGIPSGMTFAIDGNEITASGTNMPAGSYDFWITVTDARGSVSPPFNLTMTIRTFEITGTLPDASEGNPYLGSLQMSGGIAPYTPVITSGALPSGGTVTIDGDQLVFQWATATAGTYTFGGTVTDANGCVATFSEEVEVQTAFLPSCITDGFWLAADETTNSMLKDTDSDHFYEWTDNCHGFRFVTTYRNGGSSEQFDHGPSSGSINGIRAAHFNSLDANCAGIEQANQEPTQTTIKGIAANKVSMFIASIWRNDSQTGTDPDRRVLYVSVEPPGNGNNIRFGLNASSGLTLNGVSGTVRQDYLDGPGVVSDNTDHAADIVIAVLVANWQTGDIKLYVNGNSTPITGAIPSFAGASDSALPRKYFIGSQDLGADVSDIHLGEVIIQGTSAELSDADRQKIEGYLAWKWVGDETNGNPVDLLPVGHPYKSSAP